MASSARAAAALLASVRGGLSALRSQRRPTLRATSLVKAMATAPRVPSPKSGWRKSVWRGYSPKSVWRLQSPKSGWRDAGPSSKSIPWLRPLPRLKEVEPLTAAEALTLDLRAGELYMLAAPTHGGDITTIAYRIQRDAAAKAADLGHENTVAIKLPAQWIRDNCPCPACRNQDTAQRQVNVFLDDIDFTISSYEIAGEEFSVTFGDGHRVTLPTSILLAPNSLQTRAERYGHVGITLWGSEIAAAPPMVGYEEFLHGEGMAALLMNIRTHGFCFLDGMPATPEATEDALTRIGPIRNTHYGGFYDFTADLSSRDTAYTSEALDPHNDNTYFTEPAGLQALHLLSHTDNASGGLSTLADGFAAANAMFSAHRMLYMRLAKTPVYAHASGNAGISIQPAAAQPVLVHHPQENYLLQVRWNNADRAGLVPRIRPAQGAPLHSSAAAEIEQWYDAATVFARLLRDRTYEFQLVPGRMLLFDNWRVLHGRTAFTGARRICGGYINRDDFISKFRCTNYTPEQLRRSTVTG